MEPSTNGCAATLYDDDQEMMTQGDSDGQKVVERVSHAEAVSNTPAFLLMFPHSTSKGRSLV